MNVIIEGLGTVEFPDTMDPEAVRQKARELHEGVQSGGHSQLQQARNPAVAGAELYRPAENPATRMGEEFQRAGETLFNPEIPKGVGPKVLDALNRLGAVFSPATVPSAELGREVHMAGEQAESGVNRLMGRPQPDYETGGREFARETSGNLMAAMLPTAVGIPGFQVSAAERAVPWSYRFADKGATAGEIERLAAAERGAQGGVAVQPGARLSPFAPSMRFRSVDERPTGAGDMELDSPLRPLQRQLDAVEPKARETAGVYEALKRHEQPKLAPSEKSGAALKSSAVMPEVLPPATKGGGVILEHVRGTPTEQAVVAIRDRDGTIYRGGVGDTYADLMNRIDPNLADDHGGVEAVLVRGNVGGAELGVIDVDGRFTPYYSKRGVAPTQTELEDRFRAEYESRQRGMSLTTNIPFREVHKRAEANRSEFGGYPNFEGQEGFLSFPGRKLTKQEEVTSSALGGTIKHPFGKNLFGGEGQHGQHLLATAAPEASAALRRAVSSEEIGNLMMKQELPKIEKIMGGNLQGFLDAMTEDQLRGRKDMYQELSDLAAQLPDKDLLKDIRHGRTGAWLDDISGRAGMAKELRSKILQAGRKFGPQAVRYLTVKAFDTAKASVVEHMKDADYQAAFARPEMTEALRHYMRPGGLHQTFERAEQGGPMAKFVGQKSKAYFPLLAEEQAPKSAPIYLPYAKPYNPASRARTGLADKYVPSQEAVGERLKSVLYASGRSELLDKLRAKGLLQDVKQGTEPPGTMKFLGDDVEAVAVPIGRPKTLVRKGRRNVPLGTPTAVVPRPIYEELGSVLDPHKSRVPNALQKTANALTTVQLETGPFDFSFHGQNVIGSTLMNVAGTAGIHPLRTLKVLKDSIKLDPKQLMEMAENAELHPRYLEGARAGWVGRHMPAKAPSWAKASPLKKALYGAGGIDVRARYVMHNLMKEFNPGATKQQMFEWVNQLGNYHNELRSIVARGVSKTGLSAFHTAGGTMYRNGIRLFTGTGPSPMSTKAASAAFKVSRMLTAGSAAYVGGWAGLYPLWEKAMGRPASMPWDDDKAKLGQFRVSESIRASKIGRMLWGDNLKKDGYIGMGLVMPLAERGARAMGISGGMNAWLRGGNFMQIVDAGLTDAVNSFIHPFAGPAAEMGSTVVTGRRPYFTSVLGKRGDPGSTFMSTNPGKTYDDPLSLIRDRVLRSIAGEVQLLEPLEDDDKTMARAVVDFTFPRLLKGPYNVEGEAKRMRQERGERSSRRRHRFEY